MTTKTIALKDLPEYKDNPFMEGFSPTMRKKREVVVTDDRRAIVNMSTGEIEDDSIAIARVKFVDSDQFVKLYVSQLHVFFDLSRPAQRVVEFMLYRVSRTVGAGEALLQFVDFERFFEGRDGGSRPTFERGLRELAAKRLVAKSLSPNVWFVNPTMTFNGDRARFVTEYRRKKLTKQELLEAKGQMRLEDAIARAEQAD